MDIPEKIFVSEKNLKKKVGRKETWERRKKQAIQDGKVKGNRLHYSDKKKMDVACSYAVCGNSRRVSELHDVPEGTIRAWKQTEWWNEIMSRIIQEQDEELGSKLTNLIDKAVDQVNDRLDNGDWIYNPKSDKLVRKPINAKDLAIVTAITVDKRQLLRGQPTSRVEKVSQDERLTRLQKQFQLFVSAKEVVQDNNSVGENYYAIEEGSKSESSQQQHQNRDESWQTPETSNSDSDVESRQELQEESQEEQEENLLTINEMFSE